VKPRSIPDKKPQNPRKDDGDFLKTNLKKKTKNAKKKNEVNTTKTMGPHGAVGKQ